MCHSGKERSQGGQFFGLDKVSLAHFELFDHLVEGIGKGDDLLVTRIHGDGAEFTVSYRFHRPLQRFERLYNDS